MKSALWDHSLFCNTLLSGVIVEVGTGVLLSRSGLLCWTVCVVSSICLQCVLVCASACTFISTTTWFLSALLWFRRCAFLFGVEGDRCFFLGIWLATFQIVAMGSSALIQIKLTVTALALACRFQVNFFSSTSVCFRGSTNSTGKPIVVRYLNPHLIW